MHCCLLQFWYAYFKTLIIRAFVRSYTVHSLQQSHLRTLYNKVVKKFVHHPDENLGLLCTVVTGCSSIYATVSPDPLSPFIVPPLFWQTATNCVSGLPGQATHATSFETALEASIAGGKSARTLHAIGTFTPQR